MMENLLLPPAQRGLGKSPSIQDIVKATNNAAISLGILESNKDLLGQKYAFPAKVSKAKTHTQAAKFGYNPINRKHKKTICACCSLPINKEDIELCHATTDVEQVEEEFKLTSGIVMFFSFIKMLIYYLILRAIITDGYNVITNLALGGQCELENKVGDHLCTDGLWSRASAYNKLDQQQYIYILDILNLITIVLSIIYFLFYRKRQYEIFDSIDANFQTQDDYTLFVEGIPILDLPPHDERVVVDYRTHLKSILQDKIQAWLDDHENWDLSEGSIEFQFDHLMKSHNKRPQPQIVTAISLCYDLQTLQKIPKIREQLMDDHEENAEYQKASKEDGGEVVSFGGRLSNAAGKIDYINETQLAMCEKFAKDCSFMFNLTHFVSCGFVSFQYQHYRDYIRRECEKDSSFLLYNMESLQVEPASYPNDINWQNLKVKKKERRFKTFISFLIMIMVLVFSLGALILNDVVKLSNITEQKEQEQLDVSLQMKNYALTILGTIFTLIVNYILSLVIGGLTKYERHQTKTHENLSLIIKMLFSQFFNTAVIYYIISKIMPKPMLSSAGLVVTASSLIVVSGFIQIGTNAVHIPAILRRLKLWWYYSDLEDQAEVDKFQIRLNQEFQFVEFNLAERYSYYLLQVYMASFYSYLAPIGIFAVIVIFIIQYWIDKFNLLARSSLFVNFNYSLSRNILILFQGSVLIFAIGNFIFSIIHHNGKVNTPNIIGLIISLIYICFTVFVPSHVKNKIFSNYESLEIYSYEQCVKDGKFTSTYWSQNPAVKFIKEEDMALGKGYPNEALQFNIAGVFKEITKEEPKN